MKIALNLAAAATLLAVAALPAQAVGGPPSVGAVSCADSLSMSFNSGYLGCQGAVRGNLSPGQVNVVSFDGYGSFELVSGSPFAHVGTGTTSGELTLATAQTGLFVIGLKGGPGYSLYLFDGSAGAGGSLSTLDFDTYGLAKGNGVAGPALSHASLFVGVSPVPEPGSSALLLAGLGVVGLLASRRRTV